MKNSLYVYILVILSFSVFSLHDHVIELTSADLHTMTTLYPKLLVFYYLPWCDHCHKLAPIYNQLASQLQDEGSPIKLAKINLQENEEAYDFAQVMQVPLLKYYSDGDEVEFAGDRTLSYLHKWVTKRVKFPILPIHSHQLQSLKKANSSQVSVVYYGSMKSARAAEFISMAYHDNYNHYYYIEQGPEGKIQILRSFDQDISALVEPKEIESWIRQHDRPSVVPLDERSINHIFRDGYRGVFFFIDLLHSKTKQEYIKAAQVWKASKSSNIDLTFIAIPQQHQDYFGLMEYLELHAVDRPIAVVDGKLQTKYILNNTIDNIHPQTIIKFLTQIQAGQLDHLPLEIHSHEEGLSCPFEFNNITDESPNSSMQQASNQNIIQREQPQYKQQSPIKKEKGFLLTREL